VSRSGREPPREAVEALAPALARKVRLRFSLDAEAFARRTLEIVGAEEADEENAARRRVERLSLNDLYLACACAAQDPAAWEEMSRLHFPFIRDFALRCVRRDPPASDVADRVIADLWQRGKIGKFSGRSALRTWLGTVVAHTALNLVKGERRTVPLDGEDHRAWRARNPVPIPADEIDPMAHAALGRLTGEALRALSASERLLLLLHYEQGMTLEEMAVVLGSSKASLSRRLKRVRNRLRGEIDSRARARVGSPAGSLLEAIDFGRVELDLASLLGGEQREEEKTDDAV
jgi:RNA polymerase sigma-70 factor (ECF subfamily)